MPVRHEGDFERKPIQSWDAWVEDAIQESQERGEFDDLPDAGKPIRLEDTPFAPEMASALRTLKNAGYAPTWMELDRQITQGKAGMEQFLTRSAAYLSARIADLQHPVVPKAVVHRSWWRRLWGMFDLAADASHRRQLTLDDLVLIRARMREQYLERAAAVDKLTTDFHAALPRNLWHLERMRVPREAAGRTFDDAIPPLPG